MSSYVFVSCTLLFSMLIASCTSMTISSANNAYTRVIQSWQGSPIQKLESRWGEPDQKSTTSSGTTIYTYFSENYKQQPPKPPEFGTSVNAQGRPSIIYIPGSNELNNLQIERCTTHFIVNAKNVIITATAAGNGCETGTEFINKMAKP